MPLFFVVSGYLTHKEREENFKRMLSRLLIRSRTLLVPLVVWSIVQNICDGTVSYSLSDIYRGGVLVLSRIVVVRCVEYVFGLSL